jgi:eukaryotic-like serine/threonine-protein kinase
MDGDAACPVQVSYRSLSDVVQDDGPLPPVWAARAGVQILSAIHAVHGVGVVHRDINPGNVLLGPAGRVMLVGFGMVTADGSPALTTPEASTGSRPTWRRNAPAASLPPLPQICGRSGPLCTRRLRDGRLSTETGRWLSSRLW